MTYAADNDTLLKRLGTIARSHPELEEAAMLYSAVLPAVRDAGIEVSPVPLSPEEIARKIAGGEPLLRDLELDVDSEGLKIVILRIASAIEALGGQIGLTRGFAEESKQDIAASIAHRASEAARLRCALLDDDLDIALLLAAAGDQDRIAAVAYRLNLERGLLSLVVHHAFRPALLAWQRDLTPKIEALPWQRGNCPICGAAAALGELRGNNQALHLRCAQCGADWPFRRMVCSGCGTEDHRQLGCLYAEGSRDTLRVETCDICRHYLKVIASFSPVPAELLAVEDLATLHLDYIARNEGYSRKAV